METTKVLVRQKTIHYVQYSEYQLTDLAPDTNGEYKTELVIKLLKTSCPVETLITQWVDANPDRDIGAFTRITFEFGFPIKPIDEMGTYLDQDVYTFEMNKIEDLDEVRIIWVDAETYANKMNVVMDFSGQYSHIAYMRFRGCDFRSEIKFGDKNGTVLELVNCDISEGIQIYETRENKKKSIYCMLTECTFKNVRGINVDRAKYFMMKDCLIESAYNDENVPMMSTLAPVLSFKNSEQIVFENISVRTILTGFNFNNIDNLRITGLRGKEPVIDETIKNAVLVSNCKEVIISSIDIPGITVDLSEVVNIADVKIGKTVSQNADFAIKVMRCTGKISIADVECDFNTVKTMIGISMCRVSDDDSISVCETTFANTKQGLMLESNYGSINICNCNFTNMKDGIGFAVKSHAGSVKFIDCQFNKLPKPYKVESCENLDFVSSMMDGNTSASDSSNIEINNSGDVRIIDSKIKSFNFKTDSVNLIRIKGSALESNILDMNGVGTLEFEDSVLSRIRSMNIQTGNTLRSRYTSFEWFEPKFDNFQTVQFNNSIFKKGVTLTQCGTIGSYIKECEFGESDDVNLFIKGIELNTCSGIEMTKNTFIAEESKKPSILKIDYGSGNIFDHTNEYPNRSSISINDWSTDSEVGLNNNHIIVDTDSEIIPEVSSTNNFRYMLSIFNRNKYLSQYSGKIEYDKVEDVVALKLNTVSMVSLSETWVLPYIKQLNAKIKIALNEIS